MRGPKKEKGKGGAQKRAQEKDERAPRVSNMEDPVGPGSGKPERCL